MASCCASEILASRDSVQRLACGVPAGMLQHADDQCIRCVRLLTSLKEAIAAVEKQKLLNRWETRPVTISLHILTLRAKLVCLQRHVQRPAEAAGMLASPIGTEHLEQYCPSATTCGGREEKEHIVQSWAGTGSQLGAPHGAGGGGDTAEQAGILNLFLPCDSLKGRAEIVGRAGWQLGGNHNCGSFDGT